LVNDIDSETLMAGEERRIRAELGQRPFQGAVKAFGVGSQAAALDQQLTEFSTGRDNAGGRDC
jgi:hypothetical protein